MMENNEDLSSVIQHVRKIINQNTSIPAEEKEGILKLMQVLVEAAGAAPFPRVKNSRVKTVTQEMISKHSLISLVKQQADELDALRNLSLNLTSSLDLQTVLDTIVTEAMRLVTKSNAAHIFLFSHGKLDFGSALYMKGIKNEPLGKPRKDGLTASVAKSGKTIIVEDVNNHPHYKKSNENQAGSIIGVPLKFNNSIVGVMVLSRSSIGGFSPSELRLIGLLADRAAVAISNANLHKVVTELANTDSLTALPNRHSLDERLEEDIRIAKRNSSQFSVVMMDLDGFKNVNDTYGHAVGDEILHSLFNNLARNIRPTDFLARYGGDELTLIIREADQTIAEIVTQKIIELVKKYTLPIPEIENIQLGISAGIAVYPSHSGNTGDLLRAADTALYHAKKHNRGSYSIAKGATGPLPPTINPLSKKK